MNILEKNETLFIRDENEVLIPQKLVLELLSDKPEIKAIPMVKGELQKLRVSGEDTTKDQDNEIILKYCKEPKYEEKDLKFIKPTFSNAIVIAIMSLSTGIEQSEFNKLSKLVAVDKAMDDVLKKNE